MTSNPVYLIHHAGSNYSRITLSVAVRGMKILAVALDTDGHPISKPFEAEIKPETTNVGIDIALPPDSYVVIRDLANSPREVHLDA